MFWLVAIVGGFVAVAMLLVCRETYAPLLLRRKLQRLRRETGNPRLRAVSKPLSVPSFSFPVTPSHYQRGGEVPLMNKYTDSRGL